MGGFAAYGLMVVRSDFFPFKPFFIYRQKKQYAAGLSHVPAMELFSVRFSAYAIKQYVAGLSRILR
jgi:hypothetical protein